MPEKKIKQGIVGKRMNRLKRRLERQKIQEEDLHDKEVSSRAIIFDEIEEHNGNKIISMKFLAKQLWCDNCGECLSLENVLEEFRRGLGSILLVKCHTCFIIKKVTTSSECIVNQKNVRFSVNPRLVKACLDNNINYTQLDHIFQALNIPTLNHNTYKQYEKEFQNVEVSSEIPEAEKNINDKDNNINTNSKNTFYAIEYIDNLTVECTSLTSKSHHRKKTMARNQKITEDNLHEFLISDEICTRKKIAKIDDVKTNGTINTATKSNINFDSDILWDQFLDNYTDVNGDTEVQELLEAIENDYPKNLSETISPIIENSKELPIQNKNYQNLSGTVAPVIQNSKESPVQNNNYQDLSRIVIQNSKELAVLKDNHQNLSKILASFIQNSKELTILKDNHENLSKTVTSLLKNSKELPVQKTNHQNFSKTVATLVQSSKELPVQKGNHQNLSKPVAPVIHNSKNLLVQNGNQQNLSKTVVSLIQNSEELPVQNGNLQNLSKPVAPVIHNSKNLLVQNGNQQNLSKTVVSLIRNSEELPVQNGNHQNLSKTVAPVIHNSTNLPVQESNDQNVSRTFTFLIENSKEPQNENPQDNQDLDEMDIKLEDIDEDMFEVESVKLSESSDLNFQDLDFRIGNQEEININEFTDLSKKDIYDRIRPGVILKIKK